MDIVHQMWRRSLYLRILFMQLKISYLMTARRQAETCSSEKNIIKAILEVEFFGTCS